MHKTHQRKRLIHFGSVLLAVAALTTTGPVLAKEYKVAFVPKLVGIPYFAAMKQGLDKAGKKFGLKIIYQGPTTASVAEQENIVQSLINQHPDAIGVSANSPSALNPLVKKARAQGIAFYSSDSQVTSPQNQLRVQQVRDKALGYKVVDVLAQEIGKKGKIAIISGGPTATNLNTWIKFMKQRLKKYPHMHLATLQYAGEDINKATQVANQVISSYPDLKGIIGVNTTAVPGAAQAVLTSGKKGQIAVTGITDPNTIRQYVQNGVVDKVVLWNPIDLGYLTGWGVKQVLEGHSFKKENKVPGLGKIRYFAKTKTLLLGPPMVIDKSNINMNF